MHEYACLSVVCGMFFKASIPSDTGLFWPVPASWISKGLAKLVSDVSDPFPNEQHFDGHSVGFFTWSWSSRSPPPR
jgi:hypothetical protein